MGDPCPLDDLGVVEEQGAARELAEEPDALAEQHRRQVDGDLVDQAEVELPDIVSEAITLAIVNPTERAEPGS